MLLWPVRKKMQKLTAGPMSEYIHKSVVLISSVHKTKVNTGIGKIAETTAGYRRKKPAG